MFHDKYIDGLTKTNFSSALLSFSPVVKRLYELLRINFRSPSSWHTTVPKILFARLIIFRIDRPIMLYGLSELCWFIRKGCRILEGGIYWLINRPVTKWKAIKQGIQVPFSGHARSLALGKG